jgi:hypothetical protein
MPNNRGGLPGYIQKSNDPLIVVAENKRKASFRNPGGHYILRVEVDAKMITSGERADYIIAHPRIVDVIIELKGSDVSKAIRQIRATLPVWRACDFAGRWQAALVVRGKGIHPKLSTSVERWQKEFRKTCKMKLVLETANREYEFHEFLIPGTQNA